MIKFLMNGGGMTLALIAQFCAIIWWGGHVDQKVDDLQEERLPVRTAVLEEKASTLEESLNRIEGKLDRALGIPVHGPR